MKVWFDTEFIDTGSVVHLLSIGMVREDGLTYYAEPEGVDLSLACDWVSKNVIPHLTGPVQTRKSIRDDIVAFCGPAPEFWGYYVAYDWLLLCQLFGRMLDVPAHWPNFACDVQVMRYLMGVKDLPKQTGTEHNALDDALWTREAWQFLLGRTLAGR